MSEEHPYFSAELRYLLYPTSHFSATWHGRKIPSKVARKILYYIFFTNALSPSYPALYMVSLIHFHHCSHHPHHSSSNHPLESKWRSTGGSTQTEFFSAPSWMEAWHFFSHTVLFFSISPSLAVDGKCTGEGGWIREGEEQKIRKKKEVLWIKEEWMWRESYFCMKLAKSCLYVTAGMTVAFIPESVNIKTKRKTKIEKKEMF